MRFVDLLPIVILFGAFYLLIMRPARNRQRAQQQLLSRLEVGSQVMTTAGFYGQVASLDDDKVALELAPGVVVRVAKPAIARVVSDDVPSPDDAPEPDGDAQRP